jgi:Alkylmercury lyase
MTDQTGLGADTLDQDVRLYVFRQAADTAVVPSPAEIAAALDRPQPEIEESLRRLAAGRVLILAPNTTNIWAANPFCAVPSNFRVSTFGRTYWGICIWDALGIPAALKADATVTARCSDGCEQEIVLEVKDGELVRSEGIVHFGVPAARWWENIGFA